MIDIYKIAVSRCVDAERRYDAAQDVNVSLEAIEEFNTAYAALTLARHDLARCLMLISDLNSNQRRTTCR